MKKTFFIIALFAVMLFASSATNHRVFGTEVGSAAPMLSITDGNKAIDLNSLRGSYVLLTFWSSTDAPSRVACNNYTTAIRNLQNAQRVRHISVNLDRSAGLFNQIVTRDNLDSDAQFNVQGKQAERIIADFDLDNGYGSYLIGPDGHIAAINPSISNLITI